MRVGKRAVHNADIDSIFMEDTNTEESSGGLESFSFVKLQDLLGELDP